jgi:hypothetical protein
MSTGAFLRRIDDACEFLEHAAPVVFGTEGSAWAYHRFGRQNELKLVHPGGIKDAAGERNYLGFTVTSGHGRSVP